MKWRGIDDPDYLKFGAATINSEAPKLQKSLEGGILKSVDSLGIIRVKGRKGYRKDLLWFMFQDTRVGKNNYVKADPVLRDKLIDEVARFIEATEPKTPSETELERVHAEFNEVNQQRLALRLSNPEEQHEAATLDERLDSLATRMQDLNKTVIEEHKAMNAQLDSGSCLRASSASYSITRRSIRRSPPTTIRPSDPPAAGRGRDSLLREGHQYDDVPASWVSASCSSSRQRPISPASPDPGCPPPAPRGTRQGPAADRAHRRFIPA
jgi:hypothetical protein